MNEIYGIINAKTDNRYKNLRFPEVRFGNGTAEVVVYYGKNDAALVADPALGAVVAEECGFKTPVRITPIEQKCTADELKSEVCSFMSKFPFVTSAARYTEAISPTEVKMKMHGGMYEIAKGDFLPRLEERLKNVFTYPVKVDVEVTEFEDTERRRAEKKAENYAVRTVKPVVGAVPDGDAMSVSSVDGYKDDAKVCGFFAMATDFMSKGAGLKRSRPYEKFLLFDGDSTLQCRFFPNDGFSLTDCDLAGKLVCVFGNVEVERGRVGECSMTVRAIELCEADGPKLPAVKPEPIEYKTVFPGQFEEYVQASLFGAEDFIPESLKGAFVAFDFETTGLSSIYDKPTELGAVKMIDGVITETFHTLIDPQRPIPEEVSKKTGITDEMVKGQPLFESVLPDFYKFTRGAALIGHNIAFDFPFLLKCANNCGYCFWDMRTYDTLGIAPRAIPGIEVLTLDRVLESLGLTNDNAHRALSDATATAKAFIAMMKRLG